MKLFFNIFSSYWQSYSKILWLHGVPRRLECIIVTMQEYSVKITAGEGNFKFFPVEISGVFIFTISQTHSSPGYKWRNKQFCRDLLNHDLLIKWVLVTIQNLNETIAYIIWKVCVCVCVCVCYCVYRHRRRDFPPVKHRKRACSKIPGIKPCY